MMTNDMNDMAKLGILIGEARIFGIEVLPPDVNESGVFFTPSQRRATAPMAIRFGLAAIKGVGQVAVESILAAAARRENSSRWPTSASGWTAAPSTARCWRP